MPLRKVDQDYVRDPYRAGSGEYVAHAAQVAAVLDWFVRDRWADPGREAPDDWTWIVDEARGEQRRAVFQRRGGDECVEITYTVVDGVEIGHQASAVPPEEAYRIALDQDEWAREHGQRIFNERHPRPDAP